MSDILSTFYNKRFNNEPINYITNKHNISIKDSKLEQQGFFTFLSSTKRQSPLTPNFIQKNKDVTDMNNIYLQKPNPITYLSKTQSFSSSNLLKNTNSTKYNLIDKEQIIKEANDKAQELIAFNKSLDQNKSNQEKYSYNEVKGKPIDPTYYINKRILHEPVNTSLIKSKAIITKCLGNIQYSSKLLLGVNDYIRSKEKYQRLKGHFLRRSVSVERLKDQPALPKAILNAYDEIKPFKYKDMHPSRKRFDLPRYPIDISEIPEITKRTFDEKLNSLLKVSHGLMDMVKLQRKNIDKKVEILKRFDIK